MPSTKAGGRRKKKRSTQTSSPFSRCSSMSLAFANNNLITSSPLHDEDNIMPPVDKKLMPKTFEDYKAEFKKRRDDVIKCHQDDLTYLATLCFNIRVSISRDVQNVPLGNTTYSLKNKETTTDFDVSSVNNDTLLMPVRNDRIVGNCDSVFKRPLVQKPRMRTNNAGLPPPTNSKFKTPDVSSTRMFCSAMTITPKMNPNTPMNMMRRPKQGEVALSMTGSPLLVSAIMHDEVPTVSVPFADGRVFSIMPNPGSTPDDVPEFDEKTKQYLKTLQDHLKKFCEA